MADAVDSKSTAARQCGFKSHPGHHFYHSLMDEV